MTKFSRTPGHLLTGSDDRTSRYVDISVETEVACLRQHEDYIRAGANTETNPNLWVTGGYDHQIYLWDLRTHKVVAAIDHEYPVESLLFFPSGTLLASAGIEKCIEIGN